MEKGAPLNAFTHIKFQNEKHYIKAFLALPKRLYSTGTCMEDQNEVKSLLLNTHPLSKYFTLDKFLIFRGKEVVARFAITTYPNDTTAYLGFFECIEDDATAKYTFDVARNFAKDHYTNIVGPLDASFWIKYRLKINQFHKAPYTGEPYNREYYLRLFQNNGYQIKEHYTSNLYRTIPSDYQHKKCALRYDAFLQKGYQIVCPNLEDFDAILDEFYYLLTKLYRDFPTYKDVSLADFKQIFGTYRYILNPSMVRLAYYENRMVGFFISVPNYGNKVYHRNLLRLVQILRLRKKAKEYIMLYVGVDAAHIGLGSALSHSIIQELKQNHAASIGALARDGKATQSYVSDMKEETYEYVLLSLNLTEHATCKKANC